MNIMNKAAHQIAINKMAQSGLVDKYKKELEKVRPDQVSALEQVKVLEKRIAEIETRNTQLIETNTSLSEIMSG